MPAWGKTHSDALLWDIVAFVRALPDMSPARYHALTANAKDVHQHLMQNMDGTTMPGMETDHHSDAGHAH
jgi:hypothetical protein